MKKTLTLIAFMFVCLLNNAQNMNEENKASFHQYYFRFGYSHYPKRDERSSIVPALRAELNYGINRYIETGLYAGMGILEALIYKTPSSAYGRIKPIFFYGMNTNFHLVPLILKNDNFRFDGYIATKFGGHYCNIPKGNYPAGGNMFEYGVGMGVAYYLKRTMGIFAEFSYGYYDYFDEKAFIRYEPVPPYALRYGLTMKFKSREVK